MIELDELLGWRSELEERKNNFFNGDDNPNYGDRGYQDILEQLDEVNEDIDEILDDES